MYIKSLQLKNFRSINDQTFLFNKGDNYINGENGAGKTSIGMGIVYALTGLDISGSKSTFHYQGNDKNAPIEATVVIENWQGQKIKISQVETATSKKIFLNNKEIKRSQLDEKLKQDAEVTIATIYPDYFETLDAKKLETLLNKSTPQIDLASIFVEKIGADILKKHELLIDLSNVRSTTAKVTSQRLCLEKLIHNVQGQIEGIKSSGATLKETVSGKKVIVDEARAKELQQKISKIGEYQQLKPLRDKQIEAEEKLKKLRDEMATVKEVLKPELPKTYKAKVDKYNDFVKKSSEANAEIRSLERMLERKIELPEVDLSKSEELTKEFREIENNRIEARAQQRALEAAKTQAERLKGDGTQLTKDLKTHKANFAEMEKIEVFLKQLPKIEWDMKLHTFRNSIDKDITIQTEERLKNGTTKDCFIKAYKGRPFYLCSTGEKMHINRCFSEAINKIAKGKYTTRFFDNDELLTKKIENKELNQKFITRVKENETLNIQGGDSGAN